MRWWGSREKVGAGPAAAKKPTPLTVAWDGPPAAEVDLDAAAFCVIDVETTGLSAGYDRVIELAVVRCDGFGRPLDEWHTLVDPEGPVQATEIHGITDEMVMGAPTFDQLAPRLMESLDSAVVIAHNAAFDRGFLREELGALGIATRTLPNLCTMHLRRHVGLPAPVQHRLAWACWQAGVPIEGAHGAMADARAAAALLSIYLDRARSRGARLVGHLALTPAIAEACRHAFPRITGGASSAVALRPRTAHPHTVPAGARSRSYRDALNGAVADLELDRDEVDELHALVVALGLAGEQVAEAHRDFVKERLDTYLDDDVLTWDELEQLRILARLLAVDGAWLAELVEPVKPRHESLTLAGVELDDVDAPDELLAAPLSVCFTGEFIAMPLTRGQVQELAADAGMMVKSGVSVGLDVLVCLDPHAGTSKLAKAEANGTVVVDQDTFLALAGARPGHTADVLREVAVRRRQRAATLPKARAPATTRQTRTREPSKGTAEQVLWCEPGGHEWRRPPQRGRPPKRCAAH